MKNKYEKLVVFDLDGTLWNVNSHTDVINKYYKRRMADNLIIRMWRRLHPSAYMNYINKLFESIPQEYISNYYPNANVEVENIMNKFINKGYKAIIISNAPQKLLDVAVRRWGIEGFRTEIGKKDLLVKKLNFSDLIVVSDNITDFELMKLAQVCAVVVNKKNKRFFKKNRLKNMYYIECKLGDSVGKH